MKTDPQAAIPVEEKEITLSNVTLLKALWPFIRPYACMLCFTTLLVFAVTFFELLMPLLTQKAFDGFILPVGSEPGVTLAGVKITSFTRFCLIFAAMVMLMVSLCKSSSINDTCLCASGHHALTCASSSQLRTSGKSAAVNFRKVKLRISPL